MQTACRRCGRPGGGNSSRHDGGPESPSTVPKSSESTAIASPNHNAQLESCNQCKGKPQRFDSCIGLWTYHGLVREAVVASKFGSRVALGDALGRLLAERLISMWMPACSLQKAQNTIQRATDSASFDQLDLPDIATSVPSHLWRRIQRGGGGCQTIMQVACQQLRSQQIDIRPCRVLSVRRPIQKQAWLGEKQRIANVSGAFRVRRLAKTPSHPHSVINRHVLLIDDVMTTGATANEISKVLKAAGARRVTVAVVARACNE